MLAAMPVPAVAKDIPVEIYWAGVSPTEVLVNIPGGIKPLQRDAAAKVFRGKISVPSGSPERRTITVRYGAYSHPFDIRVHRGLSRVTFFVSHQIQGSCTLTRVSEARLPPDNLVDAVSRSVAAGELINISEPNACSGDLRFQALQARFQQNEKMADLSNGFFLINRDVEQQYRREARARGVNVDRQVAAFVEQDNSYEARQLLIFRYTAQAVGNYALALDVNDLIAARISTDPQAATFYRRQGITKAEVETYARAVEIKAASQSVPEDEKKP
jgi:hypothetical protein